MTDVMEELEGGLPRAGHRAEDGPPGPVILGEGDYRYHVIGRELGQQAGRLDLPRGDGRRGRSAAIASTSSTAARSR